MHALAALGPDWMDPAYLLQQYGGAFFWISLAIIFVECGLLFPILPGDTLLFAMGLFVATGQVRMNIGVAILLLCLAAFLGNVSGYEIGRWLGTPLYERDGRFVNKKNFDKTRGFFDHHGNKALVIGRFVPIVRTYITVVAGVSRMERKRFFTWSAVGAVAWVLSIIVLGYLLGQVFPGLQHNIEAIILLIVAFSLVPMVFEWWRHKRKAAALAAAHGESAGSPTNVADHRSSGH
ncbi:VTT domain-containing protein [Intrasporangium sp.]|uniref:DedA family protein n=1 Tax=Intrasporangium sp. TaxID=1925024 RepID=UPI0032221EF8